jgi:hypothetical protein
MQYFLRLDETEDNLALVRVCYNDIEQNQRFKQPGMPEVDAWEPPSEPGKYYAPYYNKTTGAVEWVVTGTYEVPEPEGE